MDSGPAPFGASRNDDGEATRKEKDRPEKKKGPLE
jgi:hypothetical protein